VFWVIDGNSEIDITPPLEPPAAECPYSMVGNVLTSGYFEIDADNDADTSPPEDVVDIFANIYTVGDNGDGNDIIINEDTEIFGIFNR
jgi:hypothetical protein